jgi:predicted RND superfamily exporter protein
MLLSGFVTLMFSDFASVFYMGLLITLTLAFAFVAELLLLPALVLMIMPRAKSSTNEVDGRR